MSDEADRMTFIEHLTELRTRIIRSCIAILVCIGVCVAFYNQIFALVVRPLGPLEAHGLVTVTPDAPAGTAQADQPAPSAQSATARFFGILHEKATPSRAIGMTVLNPFEAFIVQFRLSAYAGIALAFPYIIFQLCAFIFPGLKPGERQAAQFLLVGSAALVLAGVCVAYFLVFPIVLPYIVQYAPPGVTITLRMSETVSMILMGLLGFAAAFQFPMAVLVLVYLGLLTPAMLRRHRRVVIVGLFAIAAVITPPDPFSMILMATPLVILYELSIWTSYLVLRHARKQTQNDAEA